MCGPDDLYKKVWVQIDVPVAASHKPIAYKFLKISPRRTPPEYEHLGSRSGNIVNRRLEIPEDQRYKGGKCHLFSAGAVASALLDLHGESRACT